MQSNFICDQHQLMHTEDDNETKRSDLAQF